MPTNSMPKLEPIQSYDPPLTLTVSVALCTFNGETYIQSQLDSILQQTLLPSEIVICDDGSSDATLELVRAFAESAPFPVRIVTNSERLGATRNFEKSIRLCTGDIIALCDQDDFWYPEKLETLVGIFQSDPDLGGVFSDGDLTGANRQPLGITLWQAFLFRSHDQQSMQRGLASRVLFRRPVVTGATLAFRSSLRNKLLPIPASWVHDAWIAWMLILNARLGLCPKRLIAYRIHPSQQIGAPTGNTTFLASMLQEGIGNYLKRMRAKHIAEYEVSSHRFSELTHYLQRQESAVDAHLIRDTKAMAAFSHTVARVMIMPRILRFLRILGLTGSYRRYSARPFRLLIRDMLL